MRTIPAVAIIALSSLVWAQNPPATSSGTPRLMTPQDLTSAPAQAADRRVIYGADANQFAELRVPGGAGLHPVVVLVHVYEEYVPLPFARAYVQAAGRAGDRARMILIPGVGHFEIASPRAAIWPTVESAIRSLIDGKLPPP